MFQIHGFRVSLYRPTQKASQRTVLTTLIVTYFTPKEGVFGTNLKNVARNFGKKEPIFVTNKVYAKNTNCSW